MLYDVCSGGILWNGMEKKWNFQTLNGICALWSSKGIVDYYFYYVLCFVLFKLGIDSTLLDVEKKSWQISLKLASQYIAFGSAHFPLNPITLTHPLPSLPPY